MLNIFLASACLFFVRVRIVADFRSGILVLFNCSSVVSAVAALCKTGCNDCVLRIQFVCDML